MNLTYIVSQIYLRFNRYIVECKLNNAIEGLSDYTGFNRYIVECKY